MLSRSGGSAGSSYLVYVYSKVYYFSVKPLSSVCASVGYAAGLLKLEKYVYYTKYLSVDMAS